MLGFALHDLEGGRGAGGLARADRGAENRLLRMKTQIINKAARTGDKTSRAGQRLGQGAHPDVHVGAVDPVVLADPAAGRAQRRQRTLYSTVT